MKRVGIVILQYNHSEATLACLDSVLKNGYESFFVVLVDNGSDIKHIEAIETYTSDKVSLIKNRDNLGYAGGNNIGAEYAFKSGADYILILNNDTLVPPNLISKFVSEAINSDNAVLSCAIDEGDKIIYGGEYEWFSTEGRHLLAFKEINPPNTYLTGACLFISKKIWDIVGPISEKYFLYFEDLDYSVRIKKAGFKQIVLRDINIKHEVSTSSKSLGNPFLFYLHYRNSLLFQSDNAPIHIKILIPFYIFIMLSKIGLRTILGKDAKITKAMYLGIKDFIYCNYGHYGK